MHLINSDQLNALPRTKAYLHEHEQRLRSRERNRMDHAGWYGYVYPKNLAAHDLPKLGVAATVRRLEIAADLDGSVYFHNVRVNGILPRDSGPSLPLLLLLLNSRLLDWIFRRGSVPHANDYFAANKQFIAPLPIRLPASADQGRFNTLGTRMHSLAAAIAAERGGFASWLGATLHAVRPAPVRQLATYETMTSPAFVDWLVRHRRDFRVDPRARGTRELLEREHRASVERLVPQLDALRAVEREADDLVFDLYELSSEMRRLVVREY